MAIRHRLLIRTDLPLFKIQAVLTNGHLYKTSIPNNEYGFAFDTEQARDEAELQLDNEFGDEINYPAVQDDAN